MERKFLKELGLEDVAIDKVMAENGKDIEAGKTAQTTLQASIDSLNTQLTDANKTIKGLKDLDPESLKTSVSEWEKKYKDDTKALNEQLESIKLESGINEVLAAKKFVNDFTKDSIKTKMLEKVKSDESKGKSYADILAALTQNDKGEVIPNIFADGEQKPPAPPTGNKAPESHVDDDMSQWLAEAGVQTKQ